MNELVMTRTLEVITAEAKVVYERISDDWHVFASLMLEAKPLVPHGKWTEYLEENFPMVAPRQARRWMQAEREGTSLAQPNSSIPNRASRPVSETQAIAERQGIEVTTIRPIQHYSPRELTYHFTILNEVGKYLPKYDPSDLKALRTVCVRLCKQIDDHLSQERTVTWLSSQKKA